ncbi:hypothetical protein [Planomonospora sp. ID82291]|uniref:hypothetical protein n=1 Tax=Planomonospora sp. ID82291 TaxID=2738136 RepID=UPI0018C432C3|nr:hypothetical protein [Planomonospora sp. ID82291]MBG0814477.1 hypothetical protein [Planomonospora sp. ID82291]
MLRRTAPAVVASVALALLPAFAAVAGTAYTVEDGAIPSPNEGKDELGAGARIANRPFGYYIGRVMSGSDFIQSGTAQKNHAYGRLRGSGVNMCGWIHLSARGGHTGSRPDSCSMATARAIWQRTRIGTGFSAPAGTKKHSGVPTRVATGQGKDCRLYYNYFSGTKFTHGAFRDPAHADEQIGRRSGEVNYRFRTLDGGALVVLDGDYGWGFVRPECVTMLDARTGRPIATFNDPDRER